MLCGKGEADAENEGEATGREDKAWRMPGLSGRLQTGWVYRVRVAALSLLVVRDGC